MNEFTEEMRLRLETLRAEYALSKGATVTNEQKKEMQWLHHLEHLCDVKRFGETLDWLTKRLYFYDPVNLIPAEIPLEEYDIEARMILRDISLLEQPNLEKVLEIVYEVFVIQFGQQTAGTIDQKCYSDIAKELIEKTSEWKRK